MNFKKITAFLLTLLCVLASAGCAAKETGYVLADDATMGTGLNDEGYIAGVKATKYVTLPQVMGVTVPAEVGEASQEDLQEQIDFLLEQYAVDQKITDRAAVDGDAVRHREGRGVFGLAIFDAQPVEKFKDCPCGVAHRLLRSFPLNCTGAQMLRSSSREATRSP